MAQIHELEDEMDQLLRFPVERVSKPQKRISGESRQQRTAEILFFSGVRYSKMTDADMAFKPVRTKRVAQKSKR